MKGERDAGSAIFRLWEDTVKKAKREGKIPMLAMHKRGTRTEFVAIPLTIATKALLLYFDDIDAKERSAHASSVRSMRAVAFGEDALDTGERGST